MRFDAVARIGTIGIASITGWGWVMAMMDGTADNDTLTGTAGNDTLNGLGGNDLLLGLGGDDLLNGGEGNDTLRPGLGNATLDGGDGTDTVDLSGIALGATLIIASGSGTATTGRFELNAQLTSIENLIAGPSHDLVVGDDNPNRIDGGDGDDILAAGGGSDTVLGGNGNDVILAVDGNDSIDGGPGDDEITPGAGSDTIIGGPGANTLKFDGGASDVLVSLMVHTLIDSFGNADSLVDPESFVSVIGGSGNDNIGGNTAANMLSGLLGNDTLLGLDGADTLLGGNGNDSLDGGNDNDSLDGGAGNDTLDGGLGNDLLVGGTGSNTINDAGGNDTVRYEAESSGVVLAADRTLTHTGGVDTIAASVEQINGSSFNDGLVGSNLNDRFLGFSGNDLLNGADGNDFLDSGRGDDTIYSGNGNDTLIGGLGNDFLVCEPGNNLIDATLGQDIAFFGFSASAITVNPDNTVVHDNGSIDTILGSAVIIGTPLSDFFNGGSGNDSFQGSNGSDVIGGGGGDDTLDGGIGNDILDAGAGASALLFGGQGNDVLNGGTTLAAVASYASSFAGIVVDATTNIVQDGFGGNDTLVGINAILGSTKNDTMSAGAALDRLVVFQGGGGDDSFVGGGFDLSPTGLVRVSYDLELAGIIVNLEGGAVFHDPNADVLTDIHDVVATRFADQIIDSSGNTDRIDAGAGDDSIEANGGNDTILAGAGNDTVALPLVTGNFVVDFGPGDDDLLITELMAVSPPPQAVGTNTNTTWQAIDAMTLMATTSFEGDTLGSATIGKGSGTLTIELDGLDQIFAIAAFAGDLLLHPQGDLSGTLGMGDDTVTAASGTYTLDGGGGINTIDYSIAGGIAVTFSGDQATVTPGGPSVQTVQHFLRLIGSPGADTVTGDAFNSVAAFTAAQVLALIDDSLVGDPPSIQGGGGGDSYSGRVVVDYTPLGGPVQIAAAGPAGSFAANTGSGNDTLAGVYGVVLPDQDNSVSLGSRSAVVEVTGGSNSLIAGDGAILSYRQLTAPLVVDLSVGTATHGGDTDTIGGIDNVIGGAGDDMIQGNQEDNLIAPGGGSNLVLGGDGTDTAVFAMSLQAIIDPVYFSGSQRLLFATLGDGPAAVQALDNVESANFAGETVAVGDFARPLPDFAGPLVSLSAGAPAYLGSARNENVLGNGDGNVIIDQGGANLIDGQGGNDLILMTGLVGGANASAPPPAPVSLPPEAPVGGDDQLFGGGGNDTIQAGPGADIVDGGTGDDVLAGDAGTDSIAGDAGNDLIFGGAGNDFLAGESGNDAIFGEAGQDVLAGGDGDDRLSADAADLAVIGGQGIDTLVIQGGGAGLSVIDLGAADNQNLSGSGPAITGIERVDASASSVPVSLHGAILGNAGSVLIGSDLDDTLTGSDGADTLSGSGGDDLIDAGLGNDTIVLDAGNDTVTGGGGRDLFIYRGGPPGAGIVEVEDYASADDLIRLPSNLPFTLATTGDGAMIVVAPGTGLLLVGVPLNQLNIISFVDPI